MDEEITYRKFTAEDGDKDEKVSLDKAIKMVNKAIASNKCVIVKNKGKSQVMLHDGKVKKKKKSLDKVKELITKATEEIDEINPIKGG